MQYWLVKSEPGEYSIDDLRREKRAMWDGVRNYQARNFLKRMKTGDRVLFYHSVTKPVGVVGVATVAKEAYPDPTQFDKGHKYFDEKAEKESPRWFCPDLKFTKKFKRIVTLDEIKSRKSLEELPLVRRGNRLSVMPVGKKAFEIIEQLGQQGEK